MSDRTPEHAFFHAISQAVHTCTRGICIPPVSTQVPSSSEVKKLATRELHTAHIPGANCGSAWIRWEFCSNSVPNSDLASPSVLSPNQRLCDPHGPNLLTLCVSSMKGLNPGFLLLDPLTRPGQNSTRVRSSMLAEIQACVAVRGKSALFPQ